MPEAVLPAHPEVWVESIERVWNGRFPLDRIRFRHRRFNGSVSPLRTWELWRRGRAAALLPYDPVTDQVVLIDQFRLPALAASLDPVMIEAAAGLCDAGETPEQTVTREAREEMELTVDRLEHVGDFLLTPGGADELTALFVGRAQAPPAGADGIAGFGGMTDENEDIRVRVWPAERAIAAALSGKIANSVAAIALLWLAARRTALRAQWSKS
jgi:ADP-ribose pyrophosphatase